MKTLSAKSNSSGITLIEMLVIIAVIAVLAGLLLPPSGGPRKAKIVRCAYNLKNINESFVIWSQSREGNLPMQLPSQQGGTRDYIQSGSAVINFLALTNSSRVFVRRDTISYYQDGSNFQKNVSYTNTGIELRWFVCPSEKSRSDGIYYQNPNSISEFVDTNISYFVGVDANFQSPKSILAGDRHLQIDGLPVKPGLLDLAPKSSVGWTEELHYSKSANTAAGNLLFADGHVEFLKQKPLSSAFHGQQIATSRLCVP